MKPKLLALLLVVLVSIPTFASHDSGFEVEVLVGHEAQREYSARGTTYVEAIRGERYAIRLTNPTGYRVAVALSVDGLNTISGKHTSAKNAPKWIIEPYDSIVISGWQVSDDAARQFYFTGERNSYGAKIGEIDNLGVIEAHFYRERVPVHTWRYEDHEAPSTESRRKEAQRAPSASAAPPSSGGVMAKPSEEGLSDDYAATGMGDRRRHEVERIHLDLEDHAAAKVRIRYGFRSELVKLGVLPRHRGTLERREQARGFGGYAQEVDR